MDKIERAQVTSWFKDPVTKAVLRCFRQEYKLARDDINSVAFENTWMQNQHIDRELAFKSGVIQTLRVLLSKKTLKEFLDANGELK